MTFWPWGRRGSRSSELGGCSSTAMFFSARNCWMPRTWWTLMVKQAGFVLPQLCTKWSNPAVSFVDIFRYFVHILVGIDRNRIDPGINRKVYGVPLFLRFLVTFSRHAQIFSANLSDVVHIHAHLIYYQSSSQLTIVTCYVPNALYIDLSPSRWGPRAPGVVLHALTSFFKLLASLKKREGDIVWPS